MTANHYNDPLIPRSDGMVGLSRRPGEATLQVKQRVANTIEFYVNWYGLNQRDHANLLAIAAVESGFNPDAAAMPRKDPKYQTSASGVFQVLDSTAKDAYERFNGPRKDIVNYKTLDPYNRFDYQSNIQYGVAVYMDKKRAAKSDEIGEIYKQYNGNPKEYNKWIPTLRQYYEQYLNLLQNNGSLFFPGPDPKGNFTEIRGSDVVYDANYESYEYEIDAAQWVREVKAFGSSDYMPIGHAIILNNNGFLSADLTGDPTRSFDLWIEGALINLQEKIQAKIYGDWNNVYFHGSGAKVKLYGAGTYAHSEAPNDIFFGNTKGIGVVFYGNYTRPGGGGISMAEDTVLYINGARNTIIVGDRSKLFVQGENMVWLNGNGEVFVSGVPGYATTINARAGTVHMLNDSIATIAGTGCIVNMHNHTLVGIDGTNIPVNVLGSRNSIDVRGQGCIVNLNGNENLATVSAPNSKLISNGNNNRMNFSAGSGEIRAQGNQNRSYRYSLSIPIFSSNSTNTISNSPSGIFW